MRLASDGTVKNRHNEGVSLRARVGDAMGGLTVQSYSGPGVCSLSRLGMSDPSNVPAGVTGHKSLALNCIRRSTPKTTLFLNVTSLLFEPLKT